ncbi:MAG TPA: BMP family ABC transporter substrate-binding protein [Fimbriimonas sp.]|nr:BMP family ABC transporter substrate-binding protein [Fimbriimonas sp.]
MSKLQSLFLLATCLLAIGCAGSAQIRPGSSVGLVLSGSANDGGWNESAALGLQQLEEEGFQGSTTQNVSQAQQESALEAYASGGYDYVIAHGGEYTDAVRAVSMRHPGVRFIQTNGTDFGPNWRSLGFSNRQIGYIMGYMAALQSPTGKVGLILAEGEPDEVQESALHGVTDANPDATLAVAETADYDTPQYGKEAAEELLALGVDTFAVVVDGAYVGVHEAIAGMEGVTAFRLRSVSGLPIGTPEVLGGVFLNAGGLFETGIEEFEQGVPTSSQFLGFKESALQMSEFSAAYSPADGALVMAAVQGIIDGTIIP